MVGDGDIDADGACDAVAGDGDVGAGGACDAEAGDDGADADGACDAVAGDDDDGDGEACDAEAGDDGADADEAAGAGVGDASTALDEGVDTFSTMFVIEFKSPASTSRGCMISRISTRTNMISMFRSLIILLLLLICSPACKLHLLPNYLRGMIYY
ncbi:hypothetical protein [Paenibacillus radicis (ex Xue et al. 2023)]|uniref:Uncharacterized protein n=1 Tax=Paenibacillus radicis (ex Xue et al. 2023) TaxID=2972489 RepID=A0ABT1YVG2_9BACL|nr:hypothetical protein [Paenibacillus radicis (ex Xue et al. 2023)]MCR8636940.1 hypothetical protein [Paenibacillus radicis (ex Xue et al. 2023)]